MKSSRTLRELNFDKIVSEAQAQTSTGSGMLNTFKATIMRQPVTHALVNQFLNESKNYRYDNGVNAAAEKVANYINENQYSWQLATACEAIHRNGSRYNTLNENAANQVENLLDMNESDVVSYIKSGAMKNVMFVESFRRIARSVFRQMPVVELNEKYTMVHPVSLVEKNGDSIYFAVAGRVLEVKGESITEAKWTDVSEDFRQIMATMSMKEVSLVNEAIVYENDKFSYTINRQGFATRRSGDNELEMTVEQMRENNALYLSSMVPGRRNKLAQVLENLAKICENFDNVMVLDSVGIYTTDKDRFVVAEHEGQAVAYLIESKRPTTVWSMTDNIANVVEFLKKNTSTDLTESYKDQIEKVIENKSEEEKAEMQRRLNEDGIQARKDKIAQLTEQYKNDPARLAVLAKCAEDLAQLQ